ncbi:MAG: SDR family NAD(P)-dependent oxidoreductase [Bacillota bacterium]
MRVKGRVAIVTGGASGIGRGAAVLLAAEGASVAVVDVNLGGCEETVAILERNGHPGIAIGADVTENVQVESMVDAVISRWGTIDILVNCAGCNPFAPFIVLQEEDFDRGIAVNLKSIFLCCKAVLPVMTERMYGKIVNVTSIMSVIAGRGQAAYNAGKGGAKLLTQAMALDLAPYNITVNAVGPGMTYTGMTKELFSDPERVKWFEEKIPLGRIAVPEDIAPAILFLASDESRYITGETIYVDGGMLATR